MSCNIPIAKTGDCLLVFEKILTISDNTAYAADDNLGELLEISAATNEADGTGKILNWELLEYAPSGQTIQKTGAKIYFQKTTFISGDDNAAFDLTKPDTLQDIIGVAGILASTDYIDFLGSADYSIARKDINVNFQNRVDTTLYARIIATEAGTYNTSAGTKLIVRVTIQRN